MKKVKLSTEEQIVHMRDVNGIKFNITTEKEALIFLNRNNYYFKLKTYAKNYDRYVKGERCGQYINLEFAYLQELSRIDMYLRKFILKITVDIEHFAKTKLMRDLSRNKKEDGYRIVEELFEKYPYIKDGIKKKANGNNSILGDLISKYDENFAVWNVVEVLSFGDFLKLYQMYYYKYNDSNSMIEYLWSVKFLRNAAAHNSCLINSLKIPYTVIHKISK